MDAMFQFAAATEEENKKKELLTKMATFGHSQSHDDEEEDDEGDLMGVPLKDVEWSVRYREESAENEEKSYFLELFGSEGDQLNPLKRISLTHIPKAKDYLKFLCNFMVKSSDQGYVT